MKVRAALARASSPAISASVSYQAPVKALPSSGLASSTWVLTAIMSMISPGIWRELNTSTASLDCCMTMLNCGFHKAAAVTSAVMNEATASASEVFMMRISRSLMPLMSRARAIR
ncbi:hypothetical protein D3C76_1237120 [compost metagenome]